jgi:hypothetical protein
VDILSGGFANTRTDGMNANDPFAASVEVDKSKIIAEIYTGNDADFRGHENHPATINYMLGHVKRRNHDMIFIDDRGAVSRFNVDGTFYMNKEWQK